jgi:hypothetical protein
MQADRKPENQEPQGQARNLGPMSEDQHIVTREQTVWVQRKAPYGNWVDYTGMNGGTLEERIEYAKQNIEWGCIEGGYEYRIVIKLIEIL